MGVEEWLSSVTGLGMLHESVSLIRRGRSVSRVCTGVCLSGEALMATPEADRRGVVVAAARRATALSLESKYKLNFDFNVSKVMDGTWKDDLLPSPQCQR